MNSQRHPASPPSPLRKDIPKARTPLKHPESIADAARKATRNGKRSAGYQKDRWNRIPGRKPTVAKGTTVSRCLKRISVGLLGERQALLPSQPTSFCKTK